MIKLKHQGAETEHKPLRSDLKGQKGYWYRQGIRTGFTLFASLPPTRRYAEEWEIGYDEGSEIREQLQEVVT